MADGTDPQNAVSVLSWVHRRHHWVCALGIPRNGDLAEHLPALAQRPGPLENAGLAGYPIARRGSDPIRPSAPASACRRTLWHEAPGARTSTVHPGHRSRPGVSLQLRARRCWIRERFPMPPRTGGRVEDAVSVHLGNARDPVGARDVPHFGQCPEKLLPPRPPRLGGDNLRHAIENRKGSGGDIRGSGFGIHAMKILGTRFPLLLAKKRASRRP